MTAEAAAFQASWPVGQYTATLTMPHPRPGRTMHACIEWAPSMPDRLTDAETVQYRVGRDAALREMADRLRIKAGVIDV